MIGISPHTMSTDDWIFVAALQFALIFLVVFALSSAAWMTRPGNGP